MRLANIETKLEVSGEQKYKQAIKEANSALHTLGTELSLAQAQFKANGDAQQLMESRSKTLKAEIEQQGRVVEATARALQDASQKYGENSRQAEQWQAKLNSAKSRLLNMETELENNSKGLDKNGKAFDTASSKAQNFGGSLSQVDTISKGVTFQSLNTALTNIGGVFERLGQTASKVWKMVWNTASDSSDWADDLATLSLQTGINVNELQKWAYAADYIDTEVSDITKALVKLVNPSKDVTAVLKELGIAAKGSWYIEYENGAVDFYEWSKTSSELFLEAVDAMHKMYLEGGRTAELENAAKTLFGKGYQEMLPLIIAGADALKEYGQQAEDTGAILEDDLVSNLTGFNDSLQTLQNNYDAFQRTFSAEIAPGLQTASEAMAGLLSELNLWMQSDDGKEALGALSGAIADLVTSFTDNVNFSDLVSAAAGAVGRLKEGLVWISNHKGLVVGAIEGIAGAFALIKVSSTVLSFLQLARGLKLPGSGGGTSGGGSSGGGATGAGIFARAATLLKNGASGAANFALGAGVPIGILSATLAGVEAANRETYNDVTNRLQGILEQAEGLKEGPAKETIQALVAAQTPESRKALGIFTSLQSDYGSEQTALDAAYARMGLLGLSGATKLQLLNRAANGPGSSQQERTLADTVIDELLNGASDLADVFSDLQDGAGDLQEALDVIDENGTTVETMGQFFGAFDKFRNSENAWGRLPADLQARLGASDIGYSEAVELAQEVIAIANGQLRERYSLGLQGSELPIGARLTALGLHTRQEIPGLPDMQPGMPMLDTIGNFIDQIAGLDYSSGENVDALSGLFEKLQHSNLRKVLGDDTNTLLDLFFNPEEAFGKTPEQAAGLMDLIYSDLADAYLAGLEDTSTVEEAGKTTSAVFAGGLAANSGMVMAAAAGWASAFASALAAAVPAVPRGAVTNNNYSANSSLYIESYNQYSSADISDLSAAINRENRYNRMGVGA